MAPRQPAARHDPAPHDSARATPVLDIAFIGPLVVLLAVRAMSLGLLMTMR